MKYSDMNMVDINGKELAVGQTVVVASKAANGNNLAVLKKAVIVDLKNGRTTGPNVTAYVTLKYLESGRTVKIDGYLWMCDQCFCIID